MAEDNQLRDINGLTLAAVATAAGCSRLFARSTLRQWGLVRMVDDSELVISELVTNAVEATGVTDPQPRWRELADLAIIRARLLLYGTQVVIDVWDRAQEAPVLKRGKPRRRLRPWPVDRGRTLCALELLLSAHGRQGGMGRTGHTATPVHLKGPSLATADRKAAPSYPGTRQSRVHAV